MPNASSWLQRTSDHWAKLQDTASAGRSPAREISTPDGPLDLWPHLPDTSRVLMGWLGSAGITPLLGFLHQPRGGVPHTYTLRQRRSADKKVYAKEDTFSVSYFWINYFQISFDNKLFELLLLLLILLFLSSLLFGFQAVRIETL